MDVLSLQLRLQQSLLLLLRGKNGQAEIGYALEPQRQSVSTVPQQWCARAGATVPAVLVVLVELAVLAVLAVLEEGRVAAVAVAWVMALVAEVVVATSAEVA